jgi:hypothetical protein
VSWSPLFARSDRQVNAFVLSVLKKREARLKREQNGLKSLLCGLVGGPALLKEWEREWREKFGGEERDEVWGEEGEGEPASDEEFDGTANVEEDVAPASCEPEEQEEGRPMKKAKVSAAKESRKEKDRKGISRTPQRNELNVTMQSPISLVPEKRKRGRPRKSSLQHLSPSESPESSPFANEQPHVHGIGIMQLAQDFGQGQAGQCLLATFAMFSFFSSPLSTGNVPDTNAETSPWAASHPHSHTGFVLGHSQAAAHGTPSFRAAWGWRDAVQILHLFVSALVLLSVVLPWLPTVASRWKHLRLSLSSSSSPSVLKESKTVIPANLDEPSEAQKLHKTLGLRGWLGWFGAWASASENRSMNQKAWVRLGEIAATSGTF